MKGDICKIKGCENKVKWGKVCEAHYARMWRNGFYEYKPTWNNLKKGQPSITKEGYIRVNINGKRVLQHRHVMEQFLKRTLDKNEDIHHINGNKTDNRIENLCLTNQSSHMRTYHPTKFKIDWSKYTIPEKCNRWRPNTERACLVDDCTLKVSSRGLCTKHFQSYYDWNRRR